MSRIISKETINKWSDEKKIVDLKHNKQIKSQVTPPSSVGWGKKIRSAPAQRQHSGISPARIKSMIQHMNANPINIETGEIGGRSTSQYKEYRESFKKATTQLVSS